MQYKKDYPINNNSVGLKCYIELEIIIVFCKYKSGEPKCISIARISRIYWMNYENIFKNKNAPIWLKENIDKVAVFNKCAIGLYGNIRFKKINSFKRTSELGEAELYVMILYE